MLNEQLAREWAAKARSADNGSYSVTTEAAIAYILETIDPPTMDTIEWNDEEHVGMIANSNTSDKQWIMVGRVPGSVRCIDPETWELAFVNPASLTPTGEKATIRTVQPAATVSPDENVAPEQPEHPEELLTREDFEDAPLGTIVAYNDYYALTKGLGGWVDLDGGERPKSDAYMGTRGLHYKVLRWGWKA